MNDRSIIRMGGIASALAIAMAVSSCHYKELCMDHNHGSNVAVRFDWSKCTRTPQNMEMKLECVRLDDSNAFRYSLDGENGENIRLENGSWKALAWNDNESIILDYGMARSADGREIVATSRTSTLAESTQISTKTEIPLTAGNASERVALQTSTWRPACNIPTSWILQEAAIARTAKAEKKEKNSSQSSKTAK